MSEPSDQIPPPDDAAELEAPTPASDPEILEPSSDSGTHDVAPPAVFRRERLAGTVRWVWMGGYLITTLVLTIVALGVEISLLDTPEGLVTISALLIGLSLSIWRTTSRYRNWSWELTPTELIIDRGVVFKLTRVIPRVRVQHVDLSSGPLDRFFGLRQVAIYTAGTREADATVPGLTEARAEELRRALLDRR